MPIDGMRNRWEKAVDRQLADIIGDGDISHLPGAGEKLDLNDNSNTPSEWRLAVKIMRDHNVAPEWIEAGKRLEAQEEKLRDQAESRARQYQSDRNRAPASAGSQSNIESSWRRFRETFKERVASYNPRCAALQSETASRNSAQTHA